MELRQVLLKTALALLFIQFGLARQISSSFGTERLALRQLRSSLGIRSKYWPIKAEPCRNWTGVRCQNGRVVGISLSGLRRTRFGRLHPRFAVDSLANFTLLESFEASGFLLNGSIPDWFGQRLRTLQRLDLSSCSLTGLIPPSLGNLNGLKFLILADNSLTGRMSSTLGQLSSLSVLNLSGNSLTGLMPNSFSSLVNLTSLDLSSNFLSGSVPAYLGNLNRLQLLNLSDNGFTAPLPYQLRNLSQLVQLDLSKNSLSGSLRGDLFSQLTSLQSLSLGRNAFDGSLPPALWSMRHLSVLDVSSNSLTGTLPKLVPNVSSTGAIFNLSNNLFYGYLNTSFTKFRIIDLSSNYFQGKVPDHGLSNITLDTNCLIMGPKQRNSRDCTQFYAKRNLIFIGAQEPAASPSAEAESRKNKRVIFILAGTFGGLGFIVILVLVLVLLLGKCGNSTETQKRATNEVSVQEGESPVPPKNLMLDSGMGESFSYEQLLHLTGNFAEVNIIKRGHSGDIFRGILEGEVSVVVKRVDLNLVKRESFMLELELLSKASHTRLVPLLGHCLENESEKFLVYKYMPNRDLATCLHRVSGSDDKEQSLDWITRLKIAIGAAEGLHYLHDCRPPLVHRDVQASSILLDDKFEVRFGSLSEVTAQGSLHRRVVTRLFRKSRSFDQNNPGSSTATCADDVYSFGKVLLELVTGKPGISETDDASTREWIEQTLSYISTYDKEQVTKIVDPSLIVDEDLLEEVWAMAIVARSCLNPKPYKRPPIGYVLKALENPLKIVREEYNSSSARLRTTSSRRSWSTAFFGSWRQSSSEGATATANREGITASGFKQTGRVGSQSSGGNDHSSSHKRLSSEVFPEPLEIQEVETGDAR
ncbi:probable LRR receptor-like serine/threonine-protein kinase At2g16250 [Neltuma alba]|uniref:probable LRR receptor-like serine/threonine-protein kinase At2g16250 n=1 Tax=Neltuma alba TaxID=207710 RepID=UPI0010A3B862|nr:probable LRR receptor-like serine/threonine-protein kinase At2g16250 [Prosopis alba]XP_028757711.1 probable LRR receptor-like serine/threonine-protein kinase At2g16250 [Prosopis alba]XP_028757712.1 probable LRR receptor-like serine/threonine-protein kinase At2g16250 [Prosopis alba]